MCLPSQSADADRCAVSAFFLVGVTACGKSAVGQIIAESEGYDILSADSMLVYTGMDIGTAKPSRDERALSCSAVCAHDFCRQSLCCVHFCAAAD